MKLKMVRLLNRVLLVSFLGFVTLLNAQEKNPTYNPDDYKDPDQFEKFRKRKNVVAAWQINELKEGALVVRLKTNKKLIDALKAQGKNDLALEKQKEQYAINKNTLYAYRDFFTFCKVYFIYSNSTDSLVNGARSGVFLDSNLNIDPTIVMAEKFYLLAERDYAYNSSIGFVPEDSAKKVFEKGNPAREMAVVIKNKYGHQLKGPFPYYVKDKTTVNTKFSVPINVVLSINGIPVYYFQVNKTFLDDFKAKFRGQKPVTKVETVNSKVKIRKQFFYESISRSVDILNDNLLYYYNHSTKPDLNKIDPEIKKFLY